MTKQKMNNLFVKGRRAAAIALLAAMPFAQAKAYDERAYMTPGEQSEYQAYGVLPSDIENKEKTIDERWVPLLICGGLFVAGWTMILLLAATKKNGWQELRNSQKSFTL